MRICRTQEKLPARSAEPAGKPVALMSKRTWSAPSGS